MDKKRKREFNERLKAKEEKGMKSYDDGVLSDSSREKNADLTDDNILTYKRKIENNYKNKITKDKDRFQDKHYEKDSKRTTDRENISDSKVKNKSKEAIKKNLKAKKPTNEAVTSKNSNEEIKISDYQTEVKDNRIYDLLAKDQDGDGIADRYDNDFRDSDISYEALDNKKSKVYEKQKRAIKRKNYSDKLITRKGKEEKLEDNKNPKSGKEAIKDGDKKNKLYKKHKEENLVASGLLGIAKANEVVSS